MEKLTAGYQEQFYYHSFGGGKGVADIFQPKNGICLTIPFDANELDGFAGWKIMGVRDYALGLECGNCYTDGRNVMREKEMLKFLQLGEQKQYLVQIRISGSQ